MASYYHRRESDDDIRMIIVRARYPLVPGECCRVEDPIEMFRCTRPRGHNGPHVAYGSSEAPPLAIWGDDAD